MAKNLELILGEWENLLQSGYSLLIFKGYKAIDKKGAEKLIHDLYSTLEEEVICAKSYLESEEISGQEELVKKLSSKFKQALKFSQFVIINVKDFENLIKKIEGFRRK